MTGERLDAIKRILRHPDISLYTMNAPQNSLNGVTPLGMAAWLDVPVAVKMLLEESADAVAVDGMDNHGATALMYAARDGRLEVVQILLHRGARPDFRDCNHRTSIQYALKHSQILWLCELVLRTHRWRESQLQDRSHLFQHSESHLLDLLHSSIPTSPSSSHPTGNSRQLTYPLLSLPPPLQNFDPNNLTRATRTIISCIESQDVQFLYSILFSPSIAYDAPATRYPLLAPLLINRPDENIGWSPIHYCAGSERPNVHILDALYCAGADIALFTRDEEMTVLHILAMQAYLPGRSMGVETYRRRLAELYDFTVHLISDLRAPLAARDKDDETCIHVAAERGMCMELLMIFLECDASGAVREMRNSRGLTALDVAKPEFREAFGQDEAKWRCVSSLSTRTIRPATSFASLASFKDWDSNRSRYPYSSSDTASFISQPDAGRTIVPQEGLAYAIHNEPIDGGEFELDALVLMIMENLNNTSSCLQRPRSYTTREKNDILRIVDATSVLSGRAMSAFRSHLDDVSRALQELTADKDKIKGLWKAVDCLAEEKSEGLRLKRVLRRRQTHGLDGSLEQYWIFEGERERGSEDSQTTAVSHFLCPPEVAYESQSLAATKIEVKKSIFRSPSLLSLISQKLDISTPSSSTPSSPLLSSTASVPQAIWHGLLGAKQDQDSHSKAERGAVVCTHTSVGTQTLPPNMDGIRVLRSLDNPNLSPAAVAAAATQILSSWPERFDGFFLNVDSITYYNAHLANLMKIEQALPQKAKDGIDPKIRQMIKKKRKLLQEKIKEMQVGTAANHHAHVGKDTKESRVKAWFKKMVGSSGDNSHSHGHEVLQGEGNMMLAGPVMPVRIVYDIKEDCNVGREVKGDEKGHPETLDVPSILINEDHKTSDASIEAALRTSKVIMESAGRDLRIAERCLRDAEELRHLANQAASRAERIIGRALKRRKMTLTGSGVADLSSVDVLGLQPGDVAPVPVMCSLPAPLSATGINEEDDDDDIRIIRRLMCRKIESLTSDAWDELEKIVCWLRIIKEVIRGVKRRAYL
ncbi:hypothetical protein AX14_009096 [Amanita brunnescens Koide BX004]|nr:hypothetical protein AX14_009096 [Amanita brunnescens Koide BX004]